MLLHCVLIQSPALVLTPSCYFLRDEWRTDPSWEAQRGSALSKGDWWQQFSSLLVSHSERLSFKELCRKAAAGKWKHKAHTSGAVAWRRFLDGTRRHSKYCWEDAGCTHQEKDVEWCWTQSRIFHDRRVYSDSKVGSWVLNANNCFFHVFGPSHCLLFSGDGHSHCVIPLRKEEPGLCGGMGHLMYFAFPVVSPTVVQVKKCAL